MTFWKKLLPIFLSLSFIANTQVYSITADDFSFGKGTLEEVSTISKLICEAFYYGDKFRVRGELGCQRTSPEHVLEEMNTPGNTWFVLKNNDPPFQIAAVVLYKSESDKRCSIHMLARDYTLKELKLGGKILDQTVEYAKQEGKENMFLTTPNVNTRLIEFYEEHGFHLTGGFEEFCTEFQEVLVPEMRDGKIVCLEMVKSLTEEK